MRFGECWLAGKNLFVLQYARVRKSLSRVATAKERSPHISKFKKQKNMKKKLIKTYVEFSERFGDYWP